MTLVEQMRAGHVNRWQIVQTARPQTLAEHLYLVSVLAMDLAAKCKWSGLSDPKRRLTLLYWAMSHDIIEVRTGDICTPFKQVLKMAGGDEIVHQAEALVDPNHVAFFKEFVEGTPIEAFVKIADLLEALHFLQDNGLGAHSKEVLENMRRNTLSLMHKYDSMFPDLDLVTAVYDIAQELCIQMEEPE